MQTCPSCEVDNAAAAQFCSSCGSELAEACAACDERLPKSAKFCPACGSTVESSPRPKGEERKVVTVVFADLVDSTARIEQLDPEDVRALQVPYFARLRGELERFGGTVEKYIGDAVMALFGAPVTMEDDPERAVRAALAIRDGITDLNAGRPGLNLQVRIAVNTGEAMVTLDARPAAGEGMAAGDVVNTCFRLQEAAPPNGILVGETTYHATKDAIDYRAVDPVHAKGKAAPVDVWEPLGPRVDVGSRRRGEAPLIGRWHELNLLLDALVRVRRERTPQLITLVGAPGIGKSRLVHELLRSMDGESESVACRYGRSLPYGDGVMFSAIADMAKAEARILKTDSAEEARKKLRLAVEAAAADPDEARWLEAHLQPLVGVARSSGSRAVGGQEPFAAWRRFFERLAERRPLVLIFEDLHWAYDGLLDFVDELAAWARGVPLLVLCTARPDLLERRAGWGGGTLNAATVELSPLSEEETILLLRSLMRNTVLREEIRANLIARAAGNPLYAEEYARMLVERGHDSDELALPETVQGIIAARIDALPPDEKAAIQDAALLGKAAWPAAMAAVSSLRPAAAESRLRLLERKGFLRRDPRSSVAGESEYTFHHVLVRDVAYAQIPRARRAEKHRLAAEWLKSIATDRADQAELLAHHYVNALQFARVAGQDPGDLAPKARDAAQAAGDRATALGAYGTAVRFYRVAFDLTEADSDQHAELLFCLGKALFNSEERGYEELARARDVLLAANDRERAAEAEVMLSSLLRNQGRRDEAYAHLQRAAALVEEIESSPAKAYVLASLATFLVLADKHIEAVGTARDALEMAEKLELPDLRARTLATLGAARTTSGDRGGIGDLEASVAAAAAINSPELARAYLNLAATHSELGDLAEAARYRREARRAAERFGLVGRLRWIRGLRIGEHYWRGEWDEALTLATAFIEEAKGSPHYLESLARLACGHIRLARGETESAVEAAAKGLAAARAARDPQMLYPALAFAALAHAHAGERDEAHEFASELLVSMSGSELLGLWWADLAVALSELDRASEARAATRKRTRTRWMDAAAAYADGDFVGAASIYCEIGTIPDEMFARVRAAEALGATGDTELAIEQLAPALDFHARVGASAYLALAEQVQESLRQSGGLGSPGGIGGPGPGVGSGSASEPSGSSKSSRDTFPPR